MSWNVCKNAKQKTAKRKTADNLADLPAQHGKTDHLFLVRLQGLENFECSEKNEKKDEKKDEKNKTDEEYVFSFHFWKHDNFGNFGNFVVFDSFDSFDCFDNFA